MATVLVSGAESHVAVVAQELRERGASVTEVTDLADVPGTCAAAGPDAFDAYVQLAASFRVAGNSAVRRIHHFYADGVLARFTALDAALASLKRGARVIFVLGALPPEAATTDDRDARLALTKVLAQAARADTPGGGLGVTVLTTAATRQEIAGAALGGHKPLDEVDVAALDDRSYADWRTELLGLVSVET